MKRKNAKAGKPVSRKRRSRVKLHPVLSKVKTAYNPIKPLSKDEWPQAAR